MLLINPSLTSDSRRTTTAHPYRALADSSAYSVRVALCMRGCDLGCSKVSSGIAVM